MLNNITICIMVGLMGVCTVCFFVAKHFRKKYKTASTEYEHLRNKYNSLEVNYNALQASIQEKKEVQNEKDQKLSDIANGSVDDAIDRLQHRNNNRKDALHSS